MTLEPPRPEGHDFPHDPRTGMVAAATTHDAQIIGIDLSMQDYSCIVKFVHLELRALTGWGVDSSTLGHSLTDVSWMIGKIRGRELGILVLLRLRGLAGFADRGLQNASRHRIGLTPL
jgi:hypothetical protein